MKWLTIVRHAKAEDAMLWAEDFERPLTERGHKDARHAARVIQGLEPAVDWWVTSPAVRALQTADVLYHESRRGSEGQRNEDEHGDGQPAALQQERAIYEAAPETLLALVRQTPPAMEHLLLVGHNPGLEQLVAGLCAGGGPTLSLRLPTAAIAHLELQVAHWEQVRWGCGALRALVTPKVMKR